MPNFLFLQKKKLKIILGNLKIYKWADLFSKIIENPNVTEKDLCYEEEKSGNNPIMIAAKLRHKDLVRMSCE